jgi:hypothetical protein
MVLRMIRCVYKPQFLSIDFDVCGNKYIDASYRNGWLVLPKRAYRFPATSLAPSFRKHQQAA